MDSQHAIPTPELSIFTQTPERCDTSWNLRSAMEDRRFGLHWTVQIAGQFLVRPRNGAFVTSPMENVPIQVDRVFNEHCRARRTSHFMKSVN
jgi:hypothetical protein